MKNYKIKKGDKFLCIKDYVMESGKIAYCEGKIYTSNSDNCIFDEQGSMNHYMDNEENFSSFFKKYTKPKFNGKIENLKQSKSFFMVFVEGSNIMPSVKHDNYDLAFQECLRLSKKEGKTSFVMKAVTEVEQIPNVKQL